MWSSLTELGKLAEKAAKDAGLDSVVVGRQSAWSDDLQG